MNPGPARTQVRNGVRNGGDPVRWGAFVVVRALCCLGMIAAAAIVLSLGRPASAQEPTPQRIDAPAAPGAAPDQSVKPAAALHAAPDQTAKPAPALDPPPEQAAEPAPAAAPDQAAKPAPAPDQAAKPALAPDAAPDQTAKPAPAQDKGPDQAATPAPAPDQAAKPESAPATAPSQTAKPAPAQPPPRAKKKDDPDRIRGKITKVDGSAIFVQTADGKTLHLGFSDTHTTFFSLSKANYHDVVFGTYVGAVSEKLGDDIYSPIRRDSLSWLH